MGKITSLTFVKDSNRTEETRTVLKQDIFTTQSRRSLYNGHLYIWHEVPSQKFKSFEPFQRYMQPVSTDATRTTESVQMARAASQLAPSHDNLSDLLPDTPQALQQPIKDIKHGKDEKRNPKLEEKQAIKLLWDGSNANVICTPKTDDDVKFKMESWFELLEQFKREKSPSGVRLDRTKITLSNGLYREGVGFEKTGKVLGKGNYAGYICVVRDIKTGQEHAIKKMMLSVFPTNEIRCWVDMSKTGFAPHLYLFNLDGNQVIMLMQILENAVTLRSVIDEHMSDFYKRDIDAALVKPFSLFVLDGALQAVSALHSKGWTHRDLHGGNVMVQKSSSESLTVKILDFGLAGQLEGQTGLDSRGFRADISEIVRLFSALYTGEEFNNVWDVQKNWKPKLKELTTHISKSDRDELFCLIDGALAILHPADVESYRNKVKDKLSLAMGDTPEKRSYNMRCIVSLLFSREEDKTELPIQCEEELAHDLQLTELSTSLLSKKLKSNKERESVPQDVSCMEVGHHHSSGADDEATEQLQEGSPDEESVPTVQEESAPPGSCTFTSMKSTKTQQQKKFGEEEISTSLSQLLEENPNKHTELSMTIHRYTFAARLSSIVDQVPSQQFKAFQYLQSVGTDATRTTVPVPIARAVSLLQKPFRPFSAPAPVTQQYDFQSVYVSQFVYVSQLQTLMHLQQPMYPPISQSINSQAYSVINKDDTMTSLNLIDFRDLQRSTDAGGQNGRGKLYYLIAVIHKFARPFFFSYFNERKL